MGKLAKILIGLVVLIGIIIGILIYNINPIVESFRPQLTQQISSTLGKPVKLGEISFKLFPTVGIQINNVTLSEDNASSPSASVKTILLETGLFELLKGNVAISDLRVEDVVVRIIREKDGKIIAGGIALGADTNKQATEASPNPQTSKQHNEKEPAKASIAFKLQNANISDVNVIFTDRALTPEQTIEIKNIGATLKDIGGETAGSVKLSASALSKKLDNISLLGTATINPASSGLPELDLNLNVSDLDLALIHQLATAYGAKFPDLTLGNTIGMEVGIKVSNKDGINGSIKFHGTDMSVSFGQLLKKDNNVPFEISSTVVGSLVGQVEAKSLELKLGDTVINLPVVFKPAKSVSGKLTSPGINLSSIAKIAPVANPFKLEGSLVPNISFEQSLKPAGLASVNGNISLNSVGMTTPSADESPGTTIGNVNGQVSVNSTGGSGKLDLNLTSANIAGSSLSAASISAKFSPSSLELTPSSIKIFEGEIKLNGNLGLAEPKPLTATIDAINLNLASISKLKPGTISFAGNLDSLTAKSNLNLSTPTSSLDATSQFRATNGEIVGFNILARTLEKIENIPGISGKLDNYISEGHQEILRSNNTKFDSLSGSINISQETIGIQSILLTHNLYIIAGSGSIKFSGSGDIKAQLKLTPVLTEPMVLKQPKLKLLLDQDRNLVIPIIIKLGGSIPVVLPDTTELVKRAAGNTAKEALGRALDKAAPGLGGAKNVLDKLF